MNEIFYLVSHFDAMIASKRQIKMPCHVINLAMLNRFLFMANDVFKSTHIGHCKDDDSPDDDPRKEVSYYARDYVC